MATVFLGLGLCPFGLAPLGFGLPGVGDPLPRNNTRFRFLNPITKDWQSTVTPGILDAVTRNTQRVLLALMTEAGTISPLPDFGSTVRNIKKLNGAFEAELKNRILLSLTQLISIEQAIEVNDIVINRVGGSVQYTIYFLDKENKTKQQLTLGF